MDAGRCGVKSQISHRVGLLEAAMDGHNNQAVWRQGPRMMMDQSDDWWCTW